MKETFDKQNKDLENFLNARRTGAISRESIFSFQADLQALPPVLTPTNVLQTLVFEKLSLNGRPLRSATTLPQVAHSLDDSIQKRNRLIEDYKANPSISQGEMERKYFGIRDKNGNTDRSYPDIIEAIYSHTDECIFFSKLLYEDLYDHGEQLRKRYTKAFGKDAPKINRIDFSAEEKEGLLPDEKNYQSWADGLVKK
jgi:hypothetical protein